MISAVMISCDSRKETREKTLENLKETDWDFDLQIVIDSDFINKDIIDNIPKTERQVIGSFNAINLAINKPDPWIVFMEDDLIFNRHIKHNLLNWYPIKENILNFGSLYTPQNNKCSVEDGQFWYKADCLKLYGSQFYIMSKEAARWAIEHWNNIPGLQDIKLTRLSRGKPIYYHCPSLVQHMAVPSSWGGICHRAHDFDEFWKNPS